MLADRGVVRVDLADPKAPRVAERIDNTVAGQITDAVLVGGRLFLLGERGLQLIDSARGHVVDSTDIRARGRLGTAGRHIVAVGDTTLQVVDTTPFLTARPLAAPQR